MSLLSLLKNGHPVSKLGRKRIAPSGTRLLDIVMATAIGLGAVGAVGTIDSTAAAQTAQQKQQSQQQAHAKQSLLQWLGISEKDYVTQARHGALIEECDRYISF